MDGGQFSLELSRIKLWKVVRFSAMLFCDNYFQKLSDKNNRGKKTVMCNARRGLNNLT